MNHKLIINRYEKIIASCSLKEDLAIFPHGDQTEVRLNVLFIHEFEVTK